MLQNDISELANNRMLISTEQHRLHGVHDHRHHRILHDSDRRRLDYTAGGMGSYNRSINNTAMTGGSWAGSIAGGVAGNVAGRAGKLLK